MDIIDEDIIKDELINKKEINIGFFNLDNEKFNEIIQRLTQSAFSKIFSLRQNTLFYNEYTIASFEEKNGFKNELIDEDDINKEAKGLVININNCKMENQKFLDEVHECSKLNYIIITLGKNINNDILNKYSSHIYDYFEISQEEKNKYKDASKIIIFDDFLSEIKTKFDYYQIFIEYSIEKNIISFKDYLYNFNKYNKINDENQLIEYFNKFEKLSYNNDYADITIILLQIIMNKKNILKSDFTFNVKSLKCGFCFDKLSESEFDDDQKCFLCHRCKYAKINYPGEK